MPDVIVIGARCAGAPTAMLLAKQGYDVLLVDRATFPSDIPHGHFIHRHGPRRLAKWGLLDRIVATNCPVVESVTNDLGDLRLVGEGLSVDGIALGYGPRRVALDAILVDAAVKAGAELRQGFTVDEITTAGDRVTGIRGRDTRSAGAPAAERATITVGADGRNSRLARTVQAPQYSAVPPLSCWYFSYWSGVPSRGLELYVRNRRAIFAFPTNDDLFAIFAVFPSAELGAVRSDIEGQVMATIDGIPDLAERVRAGRREERIYGATDLPNFFRQPHGPGWALVGDAGCHKDPFLALGVCDALRDAEFLADALDEGLSGRRPLDEAMQEYQRRRDEASMEDYRQNLHLAEFKPLPLQLAQIRAAIHGNQDATNRFFMANEGMIPRESFFNPENLASIMRGVRSPASSSPMGDGVRATAS